MTNPTRSVPVELLRVEQATAANGDCIGLRLTVQPSGSTVLVYADQQAMPGFRVGSEFVPQLGEVIDYTILATPPAEQPSAAQVPDEREATKAAYAAFVKGGWESVKEMGIYMFQAGAAWQHSQFAAAPKAPEGRECGAAPQLRDALANLRAVMAAHDQTPEEFNALAAAGAALSAAQAGGDKP